MNAVVAVAPVPAPKPELRAVDVALADMLGRRFPQSRESYRRLASLVSRGLADGNTCLSLDRLAAEAQRFELDVPLCSGITDGVLLGCDGTTPLVCDGERIYLRRYWQLERDIAQNLQARSATSLANADDLKAPLQRLFPPGLPGQKVDWQQSACAIAARRALGIITGGPGTGKTTTVTRLLALLLGLRPSTGQSLNIRLAAPTGKAAARLHQSITGGARTLPDLGSQDAQIRAHLLRLEPVTLHRLLGAGRYGGHFRHDAENPVSAEVVIVDEASMIDIDLMHALLQALPLSCRLVLVGDKDQLASVAPGAVFGDLCRGADPDQYDNETRQFLADCGCWAQPTVTSRPPATPHAPLQQQMVLLEKNYRAGQGSGIVPLASGINAMDGSAVAAAWRGGSAQLQRVQVADKNELDAWLRAEVIGGPAGFTQLIRWIDEHRPRVGDDDRKIDAWAEEAINQLGRQQLITPLRRGPQGLDALNGRVAQWMPHPATHCGSGYVEGTPLLVTRNLYDLGVYNGDMGLVLDHPVRGQRAAFLAAGARVRWLLPDQLCDDAQYGYAISVHQSQGSEYERVLLYLPDRDSEVITKELLYTAATRARKSFVLVEHDAGVFDAGVARLTQRDSGLPHQLIEAAMSASS